MELGRHKTAFFLEEKAKPLNSDTSALLVSTKGKAEAVESAGAEAPALQLHICEKHDLRD